MPRTFVAPISFGLGDLVVSLPVIQALIATDHDTGDDVWLVARAPSQRGLAPRITGLAGCIDEASLAASAGPADRIVDLRDHPLQRDHWWGSPAFEAAFGTVDINDLLDRIGTDLGIRADFSAPVPLEHRRRAGLADTVMLVPETDGANKAWVPARWAELAEWLTADGHQVRQICRTEPMPAMRATGVEGVVAATPGEAVDVLSSCRAVVGVDTGLTHIAVQQGTPTVTIARRSTVYIRPWPHSAAARGEPCTTACEQAEADYAYNAVVALDGFDPGPRTCPSELACLAPVTPERVLSLLRSLL